jgi:hypothetical protein
MRVKKEYIFIVAIILALALYLLLRKTDRTHYQLPKIPQLSKPEISQVEISKGGTSIVLNRKDKKDKNWTISPHAYPADEDKVIKMLDIIGQLTLTALVSESKNYTPYDLDDEKMITVKAWARNTLRREFDIGKTAPSYRHTFVRLRGNHRVYHARGNFRQSFDHTLDNLRDKTVLSFEKTEIQEIHIRKEGISLVLCLKEVSMEETSSRSPEAQNQLPLKTEWQTPDGKRANGSKVNRLLTTLSRLRCERYVDEHKKEDFTDPMYTIQLKGMQDYGLSIFEKIDTGTESYPATSSKNAYPFLLTEQKSENIMIDPDEMLEKDSATMRVAPPHAYLLMSKCRG